MKHPTFTPKQHGLSAVMIGRNESEFLPKTLPPLAQFADEIIFVDTGSTDDTIKIAEAHGCKVFHFPWNDNFSDAKNHGINQASYNWILNVDCDEELILNDDLVQSFGQYSIRDDIPALIIYLHHLKPDGGEVIQESMRLFRNDDRIRFENPVHESVSDSIFRHWPNAITPAIELHLRHYGFLKNRDQKFDRNLAILCSWVEREPDNIFACYKLGSNIYILGQKDAGLELMAHAFNMLNQSENRMTYAFIDEFIDFFTRALKENGREEMVQEVTKIINTWR